MPDKDKIVSFCDTVIEACFYSLLVTVPFSISFVEIFSSVMIAVWVFKTAMTKDLGFLRLMPVRILLVVLAWTLLSCINSDYFKESFRGVFKALEYYTIFTVAAATLGRKDIEKRFYYVLAVSSFLICANGVVQYFTGSDLIRHRALISMDYLRRISSSFIHPNDFGGYLVIVGAVLSAVSISSNIRMRIKIISLLPFFVSMLGLFLTRSRGAWLSFVAAFLIMGAFKARRILVLFIAVLIVIFVMLPYTVQEHILSLSDVASGTTSERLLLWKGTIDMIKVHPFLGFGVNTYSNNFPKYKPPEYPDVRYTHNCYLHMASEVGIVGAFIFIVFLVVTLMLCLLGVLREKTGIKKDIAAGLFAGLVGFSLNSMVDTHLYSVTLAVYFYVLLGFCYALIARADEKQ